MNDLKCSFPITDDEYIEAEIDNRNDIDLFVSICEKGGFSISRRDVVAAYMAFSCYEYSAYWIIPDRRDFYILGAIVYYCRVED